MKPTLIVMCGPQACGKSTLAKWIEESHEDCVLVSRDKIRFALLGEDDDYFAKEDKVVRQYFHNINRGLQNHKYVIADATHISRKSRNQLFKNVNTNNVRVVGVWVEVPLQVAIKQNEQRTGRARVPEEVIRRAFRTKLTPQNDERFDEMIYLNPNEDLGLGNVSTGLTSIREKLELIQQEKEEQ